MRKTCTSVDAPLRVELLPPESLGLPGRVGLTFAPGKKQPNGASASWDRDLPTDLERLVEHFGATMLVPLLEEAELEELSIPALVPAARSRGLEVLHFPFEDGSIPAVEPLLDVVRRILEVVGAGGTAVIHCKGGLGRTGLVAAGCLIARGVSARDALRITRAARPGAIEPRQEAFLPQVEAAWGRAAGTPSPAASPSSNRGCELPSAALRGRLRGAWYGLALGDSLGAPDEFTDGLAALRRGGTTADELVAGGGWERGEWTDDTALALATAEAYTDGPVVDLERAARAMLRWLATDPKDVGNLTRRALGLMRDRGVPARLAGRVALRGNEHGAGNGSLMRAAATGLVRHPDDPLLFGESLALSAITHADERCLGACAAFNAVLSSLVYRPERPLDEVLAAAAGTAALVSAEVAALVEGVRRREPPRHASASRGYVLVCLERALAALRDATSLREALVSVVMAGGDTDTNAAVAGALLGARFGYDQLPASWLAALRGKRELETTLGRLLWTVKDWTGPARSPLAIPVRPALLAGVFACTLPLPRGCPRPEVAAPCVGCPIAELQDRAEHADVDRNRLRALARELLGRLYEVDSCADDLLDFVVDVATRPELEGNSLAKAVVFADHRAREHRCRVRFTPWGDAVAAGDSVPRWPDEEPQAGPTWVERV